MLIFSYCASKYYSYAINKIVESSFYTNSSDYGFYSDYLNENDYVSFNAVPDEIRRQLIINDGRIDSAILILPHNLFFGKHVKEYIKVQDRQDTWIEFLYTFDVEFRGIKFYVNNVECIQVGQS